MTAAITIIAIIIYVLSFIGMWKMFKKAGRKGWISIIPVANTAVLFLIGWKTLKPFIWQIVLGFIGLILFAVAFGVGAIGESSGNDLAGMMLVLFIIGLVLMIIGVIIGIMMTHKISKAFGHGIGCTIGLILVPLIMYPVLGFGKSEYVGGD